MSSDDGLILDGPCDPDAQAAVTDYIDYTEFLPADLMRSLTLIRGLDERYLESAQSVHELTKTFGQLPDLSADVRPSAQAVRRDVSHQLDRALDARESAYAEACRLYDVVDSHYNRLDCIKQKLHALPKPSMDPAPAQAPKHAPSTRKRDAARPQRASRCVWTARIKGGMRRRGPERDGPWALAIWALSIRTRRSLARSSRTRRRKPNRRLPSRLHTGRRRRGRQGEGTSRADDSVLRLWLRARPLPLCRPATPWQC